MDDTIHVVRETPPLLPIVRSRHQAELLAWLLPDPSREASVSDLSRTLSIPQATVSRDVARAERAGILRSRLVGRTRLVSADPRGAYYQPLTQLLVRSFGLPAVIGRRLRGIEGITHVFVFGSWAARFSGVDTGRPPGDVDLLVLGNLSRDGRHRVYDATADLHAVLGYEVNVTFRATEWIASGTGSFHASVVARPMVEVADDGLDPRLGATPAA